MYLIMGATGNNGRPIVEHLLSRGMRVRAVSRSADRLQPLVELGAEPCVGSSDDTKFLCSVFDNVTAALTMITPDMMADDIRSEQNRQGMAIAYAIRNSGVQYVVNLSSLGAHRHDQTGILLGLYDQEQRLNSLSGVNILHLRPTWFMENLLMGIPIIQQRGFLASAIRPDCAFPMIAVHDVVAVACQHLLGLGFHDISVQELLGQRDLTMREVTEILGSALGRPGLQYVQLTYEENVRFLLGSGRFSPSAANTLSELQRAINENIGFAEIKRTPENSTPTRFEAFADKFRAIFQLSHE